MYVEVNTSNGIENKETLERWATEFLNEHLARYHQDITSIEVQLTDENHDKGGGSDKRCMLEARLPGQARVAVNHFAETQDMAFRGATDKLKHALEHHFGKLDRDHRNRESIRKDASVLPEQ